MSAITIRFRLLFICAVILTTAMRLWLGRRQARHVAAHAHDIPEEFRDQVAAGEYERAAAYTVAKIRLEALESVWDAAWLLIATVGGGLSWLDQQISASGLPVPIRGTLFLLAVALLSAALSLPFEVYRTFVLEQQFGFNRTAPRLFLTDLVKRLVLSAILLGPLIYGILWLMQAAGPSWWLAAAGSVMAFQLLLLWAYPAVIAPWFNRFKPLDNPALAHQVAQLLDANGLRAEGLFVMNGSLRSTHGNAYVTGIGNAKRIVFFDTLLERLAPDEVQAVLAHEIGHVKRYHTRKRILTLAVMIFAVFAVLAWLKTRPWFYLGLGVAGPSTYMALALFLLAAPPFAFLIRPLAALMSRRDEYEADAFAAAQVDPAALIGALTRLYRDNASPLSADPWYERFYYSHPPALMRVRRLQTFSSPG